jgi:hypothetical protein
VWVLDTQSGSGVLDEADHVTLRVGDRADLAAAADVLDLLLHRTAGVEHGRHAGHDVVDVEERGRTGHPLAGVAVRDEADLLTVDVVAG